MRKITAALATGAIFLAACGAGTTPIDEMTWEQLPSYIQTNFGAVCEIENGPEYALWTSEAECREAALAEDILGAKAFWGVETVERYLEIANDFYGK